MIYADFHVHSRFSKAASKKIDLHSLSYYANMKGIQILGTGDFTNPKWFQEIKVILEESELGIYKINSNEKSIKFIITGEICNYYEENGKIKHIHNLILVPNLEIAEIINQEFSLFGDLRNGRPELNLSPPEMIDLLLDIENEIEVIPCHIWTPYYGILGRYNNYNSIDECFKDRVSKIHGIETGISSDPQMNWKVSSLDKFCLISNSDAHSYWPYRLGREATIFDIKKVNYKSILNAIRKRGNNLIGTIELYSEFGKYYYDGHRYCGYSINPKFSKKHNNNGKCPICGKKIIKGVLHRIYELSDRNNSKPPINGRPFIKLLPLHELIKKTFLEPSIFSKKVWNIYFDLLNKFQNEYQILIEVEKNELHDLKIDNNLIDLIVKNREGLLHINPGFDGKYGEILWN